jgi:hypothetical protein
MAKAQRPDTYFVDAPVSGSKVPAEQGKLFDLRLRSRRRPVESGTSMKDVHLALAEAGPDRFPVLCALAQEWTAIVDRGDLFPYRRRGLALCRSAYKPGRVWPYLEPDGHAVDEQRPHHPGRVHETMTTPP